MEQVRIGVAGWSYPDWEGVVYPSPKSSKFDPLAFLAHYFDTIEINSSFYRVPSPKTASSWAQRAAANPNFRFAVKLFQAFTHDRNASSRDEKAVKDALDPLVKHNRMGALLVQFPWSFKNERESRRHLTKVLGMFRGIPSRRGSSSFLLGSSGFLR